MVTPVVIRTGSVTVFVPLSVALLVTRHSPATNVPSPLPMGQSAAHVRASADGRPVDSRTRRNTPTERDRTRRRPSALELLGVLTTILPSLGSQVCDRKKARAGPKPRPDVSEKPIGDLRSALARARGEG